MFKVENIRTSFQDHTRYTFNFADGDRGTYVSHVVERHLCFWSSLQSRAPRRVLKNKPQLKQLFRGESVEKTNHKGSSSSDARVFKNKPQVKHLFRSENKSTHDMRLMQHTQKKAGLPTSRGPFVQECLWLPSKP